MRRLDSKAGMRIAAVAVLAAVVVAGLLAASHHQPAAAPTELAGSSSVKAELDRCRALGPGAGEDPSCRETWRRLREHFFGRDAAEGRR